MIGVQSYYFSRELLEWEKQCWELSYNSILEYTSITDIVIYTNDPSKIPFECDNVKLLPDTYKEQFDKGWWQIYKQFLYQYIKEPMLHVDTDLIFTKPVGDLSGDIICEKKRYSTTITGIEHGLGYNRPNQLLCSGIMGKSTDHEHFKESFESTLKFIKNYNGNIRDSYRWACEEAIISAIAERENLKVTEIKKNIFDHYQGKMYKRSPIVHQMIKEKFTKYNK